MYDTLVKLSIVYTRHTAPRLRIQLHPTAFGDKATPTKDHQRGKCTTLLLHAPSKEDVRMVPIQGAVL